MSQNPNRFSAEREQELERRARLQYGPELVNQSVKRWNSYTSAEQDAIQEAGNQNYRDLVVAMTAGKRAHDEDVQAIIQRWHAHIRYFYEPTTDILRGLGETYRTDPEFMAFFHAFHADLPGYLSEAIMKYVDDLETALLERLIAEDDERRDDGDA